MEEKCQLHVYCHPNCIVALKKNRPNLVETMDLDMNKQAQYEKEKIEGGTKEYLEDEKGTELLQTHIAECNSKRNSDMDSNIKDGLKVSRDLWTILKGDEQMSKKLVLFLAFEKGQDALKG